MGTLGNQSERNAFPVRYDYLDKFIAEATELAKKHSTTLETVIEAKRVLEMDRKNSILSLGGDYHDEQMGGFGEILTRIASALEDRVTS